MEPNNNQPNKTNPPQGGNTAPRSVQNQTSKPTPAWTGGGQRPKPQSSGNRQQASAPNPNQGTRPQGQSSGGGNRRPGGNNHGRRRDRGPANSPTLLKSATNSYDSVPVNKSEYNGEGGAQATQIANRLANRPNTDPRIKVIPLGGLGEVGKNMMAIEYENDIVIIDIGFGFPGDDQPGIDYIIPDITYLEKNRHKVRGIIITHGHMDHIGAAGYMLPKFSVPIYGSRLTIAFVEKQIAEFSISKPNFVVLDPDKHERVQLGAFNIELVRVTHTISDSTAVILRTPVGTIINTGDWRPDPEPLDNKPMDMKRFEEIGKEGVLLMMSDSCNCDRAGHTTTERVVGPTIDDLFSRAHGRVLISCFSSSITRVQLVIDSAAKAKRKLALIGRSTLANVELCVKLGYIKIPAGLIVRVQDIVKLPDNEVAILSTGSQGEENSALVRMSTGDHPNIKIKPNDTVILSSSLIPGNEKAIVALIDNLMREGAEVFSRMTEGIKKHGPVHVGGHGFKDDVGDLVRLVKPKFVMPIHGEFHHLVFGAQAAIENGVPPENCFVMDNGDVLELTANTAKRAGRVPSGVVLIDGSGVGDVETVVLRDRLAMASDGIFVIVATVSRGSGKLISSPDIISRGFIYMKENEELVNKARFEVRQMFERRNSKEPTDWNKFKLKLRDEIGDFLYGQTKRNPMIITVINEV